MYKEEQVLKETLEYFNGDELAASVWMTKYALKDKEGCFIEKIPEDMHKRLSLEFARIEDKFGGSRSLSEQKIFGLLDKFRVIVPQGSPMYGVGNDYNLSSLSNCVVVGAPKDNMSSIMEKGKELANLFKMRCGVGIDLSNLRPDGMTVDNSAKTTTGAWSFADYYSYVCRMIGQKGRRGALLESLVVNHPDIFKFTTMKNDKTKVTGANVSIRLTDEFMRAVNDDLDFELKWPVDSSNPKYSKIIKARDLWSVIITSAKESAEPGLLLWDNIINNLPAHCYPGFFTQTTNPCGELPLGDGGACRLISLNLKWFVNNPFSKKASFDFDRFKEACFVGMRLSDDLVELEIEKLNKIINKCDETDEKVLWKKLLWAAENGRRTGLGTHALADMLARMCLRYDSKKAEALVDRVYSTLKTETYTESVNLAQERGSFPAFDWELEKNCAFIKRLSKPLQESIQRYGRRNISILTNAPTGSVSCVSQTSSGIEPVFRNSYIRRKKLSHDETDITPDFVDDLGDRWLEYDVFHHNIRDYLDVAGGSKDALPDFFVTSDEIDWKRRIDIQAAITQNIDHSISSTINLPKGTSPETVGEIYLEAWKKGLKGVTVYVDGSRSGVLVEKKKAGKVLQFSTPPKRPEELQCHIHKTSIKSVPWTVFVGLMENEYGDLVPYEVFAGESSKVSIPKKYSAGVIIKFPKKTSRSIYDLHSGNGDDQLLIHDIVDTFDSAVNASFTRTISLALRHGTPVKFVVEQLLKDKDSDLFSFSKAVARVLKRYIKDGEKVSSDKICPTCNSESLVYSDGCVMCSSCGWTKCS